MQQSSMIYSILNVVAMYLPIYKIKEYVKKASFVLLRNLTLTIFMTENTCFTIAIKPKM